MIMRARLSVSASFVTRPPEEKRFCLRAFPACGGRRLFGYRGFETPFSYGTKPSKEAPVSSSGMASARDVHSLMQSLHPPPLFFLSQQADIEEDGSDKMQPNPPPTHPQKL